MRSYNDITGYHAQIYYDPLRTRSHAKELRRAVADQFDTVVGGWHDVPVGPHTQAMFQLAFEIPEFPRIVPWLMLNHGPLSILIHPHSGNGKMDHVLHGLWLGRPLPIYLDRLSGELPRTDGWTPYAADRPHAGSC